MSKEKGDKGKEQGEKPQVTPKAKGKAKPKARKKTTIKKKPVLKPKLTAKQLQVQHNKKNLLLALETNLGVITGACKGCKLDRATFYRYYNEDPEFKNDVDDIKEVALDFAESCLFKNMKSGKEASAIFYLKTKGKKRGYVERVETKDVGKFEDQFDEMSEADIIEEMERSAARIKAGN